MRGLLGDRQRLLHIYEAITEIENYIENTTVEVFLGNSMMRFACIKQIEIIGEAANHVSDGTKQKFSDIQWRQIVGLRHVLVHEYFGIDEHLVWQIIITDLPMLKLAVQNVLLQEFGTAV